MSKAYAIDLNIAKNIFQDHHENRQGKKSTEPFIEDNFFIDAISDSGYLHPACG